MQKTFEDAITAPDFSSDDYCGTSYAASLLGLSVATVQSLVEKGEIEAWKTLGGHRRIALNSIHGYLEKNSRQLPVAQADPRNRLRVLLVEDDEATRELYQLEFGSWNLPVDCTWVLCHGGLDGHRQHAPRLVDHRLVDAWCGWF